MASGSAGSIFVDLLLRDAKYREGLKKSKSATSDFAKGVRELARDIAPLLGGAGFLAITNKALESADAVAKAAKSLGLSSDAFQKFSYAFKLGGIDADTFTAAVIKLNNNLAQGKLPYADTQSAIFGIANRLKNAKDGIEATRIASEAFGAKLGARLIPALSGGADEITRLGTEAEKLGLVFGGKLVKNAEEFKDQIEILADVIVKNFQSGLLEQFVDDSDSIRKIYTDPDFVKGVRGLGELFGALAQTLLFIGRNIDNILAPARWLIENSEKLGQATGNFIAGRGFVNLPPNASFQRPKTVDQATTGPEAAKIIDAALKARGLPGLTGADKPTINLKDINTELDDALKKIKEQTELLALQNDHFGENKNAVEAIVSLRQIELDLASKGVTLSDADRANLQKKLQLLAGEKDLQDDLKEAEEARVKAQQEILDRQEEERKRIEDSIQDIKRDLASEITDAIKGAQSLGDAFKNVAAKIAEAVTQAQILKLLSSAGLGGDSGGGGFFGSLFGGGGIFEGLLSSFDVGTPFVPRDQVAMVHAGEMIIPRVQAEKIRQGGMGGVTVNQYISTPDANSFQRSQNQILAQTQQQLARATRRNN